MGLNSGKNAIFLAMLEFIAYIVGWMTIKTSHSTTLDGLDSGYREILVILFKYHLLYAIK
jgi:hypothetical protein